MEYYFRILLPIGLLILTVALLLFMRRTVRGSKDWVGKTDEQLALNREINCHLDRIATALEAREK